MSKPRLLSDEQVWFILNTPDNVTNAQLAETLGRSIGTIDWRRAQLRKQPWSCKVSWDPCKECGEPLIRATSIKRYHDHCRPKALKRLYASYQPEREKRLTEADIEAREERGRAFHALAKQRTEAQAHRRGDPWSDEDDEYLIQNHRSDLLIDIALELGRTYAGCHGRLGVLRRRGVIE